MKKNQNGFSVVEILAVVIVIGVIGAAGWLVYSKRDKQQAADSEETQQTNNEMLDQGESTVTKKQQDETKLYEVDITLTTEADIAKLPEYTPQSFRDYMLTMLKSNEYTYNPQGNTDTITQYYVSKISGVNISGGQAPVDKKGEGYAGGAPIIWVLTPAGTWDEETLNGPLCKSTNGGLVYEEFATECQDGDNWTKNPNGSIANL